MKRVDKSRIDLAMINITQGFGGCRPITYKWLLGDFWTLLSSAADEEWYSSKRPSSTVAVSSSELNAKVSAFFFSTFRSS